MPDQHHREVGVADVSHDQAAVALAAGESPWPVAFRPTSCNLGLLDPSNLLQAASRLDTDAVITGE